MPCIEQRSLGALGENLVQKCVDRPMIE